MKRTESMASKKKNEDWGVEYFKRHGTDDPDERVPGRDFLSSIPPKVRARFVSLLEAIADGPPISFPGGGYWEAMHDAMAGYYEVRVDSKDTHYRLFCLLERDGTKVGLAGPSVVIIDGRTKPFRTVLAESDYAEVKKLGLEYLARNPRSVLM
jgi:hypothetical protein